MRCITSESDSFGGIGKNMSSCLVWFSECGMCQVQFERPSGVILLSEVAVLALHNGFRGQIVVRCVQRDLGLIQVLEIDPPPSLPDMVSAASFVQKFRLDAGFHFRREVCELAFCYACHADAKRLQHTTHMTFEILAQADQPLAGTDQCTNAVCLNGPDINRREPPRPCQLSETFCIGCVRLVDPGGQACMRALGIDADSGQAEILKPPLQPDRQLSALVHDDLGAELAVLEPSTAIGLAGIVSRVMIVPSASITHIEISLIDTSKPA